MQQTQVRFRDLDAAHRKTPSGRTPPCSLNVTSPRCEDALANEGPSLPNRPSRGDYDSAMATSDELDARLTSRSDNAGRLPAIVRLTTNSATPPSCPPVRPIRRRVRRLFWHKAAARDDQATARAWNRTWGTLVKTAAHLSAPKQHTALGPRSGPMHSSAGRGRHLRSPRSSSEPRADASEAAFLLKPNGMQQSPHGRWQSQSLVRIHSGAPPRHGGPLFCARHRERSRSPL